MSHFILNNLLTQNSFKYELLVRAIKLPQKNYSYLKPNIIIAFHNPKNNSQKLLKMRNFRRITNKNQFLGRPGVFAW